MVMDLILRKNKNILFSEDKKLIKTEPITISKPIIKEDQIIKRRIIEEEIEPTIKKPRINNAIGINQFDRLF